MEEKALKLSTCKLFKQVFTHIAASLISSNRPLCRQLLPFPHFTTPLVSRVLYFSPFFCSSRLINRSRRSSVFSLFPLLLSSSIVSHLLLYPLRPYLLRSAHIVFFSSPVITYLCLPSFTTSSPIRCFRTQLSSVFPIYPQKHPRPMLFSLSSFSKKNKAFKLCCDSVLKHMHRIHKLVLMSSYITL